MTVDEARAFYSSDVRDCGRRGPTSARSSTARCPAPAGDLAYRLYRPPTPGPHPIVVYFHGGGWVLGDATSDDPLCRDLCVRTDAIVVSVDYRHAPEHRFPAAVEDAFAAVRWVADNAEALGGIPGQLAVCGWSAGGNLAAVVCRLARDAGGPTHRRAGLADAGHRRRHDTRLVRRECGRLRPHHGACAVVLGPLRRSRPTDAIPASRRCGPTDLSGLPPAIVVTAEFDPLRDEGDAYAEALEAAGVPTEHVRARGHTHTSLTMVDVVISGAPVRARIADALRAVLRGDAHARTRLLAFLRRAWRLFPIPCAAAA